MVAILRSGQSRWSGDTDDDGHRTYTIVHKVLADKLDGPNIVMNTPGLPLQGSCWSFDNDEDHWALCWPTMKVTPKLNDQPNTEWTVEQKFSTRPFGRCENVEDPLLEPQKVSGTFVKYTKEITKDRHGEQIKTSSHELIHGPLVEFDDNRPTVRVEQNVADLELGVLSSMVDTVNDATLWDLEPRKIKLSNASWNRKVYSDAGRCTGTGTTSDCIYFYTRVLDFDINFETFDRKIADEGTKVLHGHWEDSGWVLDDIDGAPPDFNNPQHFYRFKDRNGENTRVLLNGQGEPISLDETGTGTAGSNIYEIDVEYYEESNLLLLGIPTTF